LIGSGQFTHGLFSQPSFSTYANRQRSSTRELGGQSIYRTWKQQEETKYLSHLPLRWPGQVKSQGETFLWNRGRL
jgi:hypothetical protein